MMKRKHWHFLAFVNPPKIELSTFGCPRMPAGKNIKFQQDVADD